MAKLALEIPIYGSQLIIVTGKVIKGNMDALARRHRLPPPELVAMACCYEAHLPRAKKPNASRARWVIILDNDANLNTVVHESLHAAFYIAQWHGVPIHYDHDEPLAYLGGWVAERCAQALGWSHWL